LFTASNELLHRIDTISLPPEHLGRPVYVGTPFQGPSA
jgi:hypothetical protein